MHDYYEFFAGGGMVTAGLSGGKWRCAFANDFDHKKSAIYRRNWGGALKTADVRTITSADLKGEAALAWASFPCQDLSLAGGGAGLKGDRSGTFWPFWGLMKSLIAEDRAPRIIALENVGGTLTSHGGKDFAAICSAYQQADYTFGAVMIDAAHFVPQSRPRLFIVGIRPDVEIPAEFTQDGPSPYWHSKGLITAYAGMPKKARDKWVWWSLPAPPTRNVNFAELIEDEPADVLWHTPAETRQLLGMMSDINRAKVEAAKGAKRKMVGALDIAGLPANFKPLFAGGRTAFVPNGDQVVVHGGVSVEELVVPFVRVSDVNGAG